jgi:hypothetical protein
MSDRIKDNGSADSPSPREPETYDHAGIRALAKALGLKMSALTVLRRDPFTADGTGGNSESDGRIAGAEWFAEEVYKRLDITPEAHMRRIHYKLMSQDLPILMLNEGTWCVWTADGSAQRHKLTINQRSSAESNSAIPKFRPRAGRRFC